MLDRPRHIVAAIAWAGLLSSGAAVSARASVLPYYSTQEVDSITYVDNVPTSGPTHKFDDYLPVLPFDFDQLTTFGQNSSNGIQQCYGGSSMVSSIQSDGFAANGQVFGYGEIDATATPGNSLVEGYGTAMFTVDFSVTDPTLFSLQISTAFTYGVVQWSLANSLNQTILRGQGNSFNDLTGAILSNDYFQFYAFVQDGSASNGDYSAGSGSFNLTASFTAVPEPASLMVLAAGAAMCLMRRKKR